MIDDTLLEHIPRAGFTDICISRPIDMEKLMRTCGSDKTPLFLILLLWTQRGLRQLLDSDSAPRASRHTHTHNVKTVQ